MQKQNVHWTTRSENKTRAASSDDVHFYNARQITTADPQQMTN